MERLRTITGGVLRPGGYEITEEGLGYCGITEGSRVLDAGCGTGLTGRFIRDRCRAWTCGVDISRALLMEAREESEDQPLAQAALESLPFAAGSFDTIVCECVLCHTESSLVLREFHRVLKAGGYLLLSDLYGKGGSGQTPIDHEGPGLKTRKGIEEALGRAGFRTIHWEDRTGDLKRLAAGLMLEYGVIPEALFPCCGETPAGPGAWKDVGYYLLVAQAAGG